MGGTGENEEKMATNNLVYLKLLPKLASDDNAISRFCMQYFAKP